jgi:hypothetical protein
MELVHPRVAGRMAELAEGVLCRKTEELQMACDGRFTDSHAQMCRLHLDAYGHLTAQIAGPDSGGTGTTSDTLEHGHPPRPATRGRVVSCGRACYGRGRRGSVAARRLLGRGSGRSRQPLPAAGFSREP